MEAKYVLLALARKYKNDWEKIYNALQAKEDINDLDFLEIDNEQAITILDEEYPSVLKSMFKPPFVIYYNGDLSAISETHLVFLLGDNIFDFDTKDIVSIENEKVNVGGKLTLWTNDNYKLATALVKNIAITRPCLSDDLLAISNSFTANVNVYVKPTAYPSDNNKLIKDGAFLIDRKEDIYDTTAV